MSIPVFQKALVAQFVSELYENLSAERLPSLVTPDFVAHPWSARGVPSGPDGLELIAAMLRGTFTNARVTLQDIVAEGDRVAARYLFEADHTGDLLLRVPATGRRVKLPGILIAHIRDGRICEYWREEDQLGLLMQLGALPGRVQRAA